MYDDFPSGMRSYLKAYGWHFSKAMCDWAVSMMEKEDGNGKKVKITPFTKEQVDFLEDSGQLFTWLYPLHCLLLTGEDKDCYYFNDPLEGKNVAYPKEQVEAAYEGIGMQAVVLEGSVQ